MLSLEFPFLSFFLSSSHQSDGDSCDPSFSPPLSPSTTPLPLSEEEEDEEEARENPRFAKPKDTPPPPPLPHPRPKWQVCFASEHSSALSVVNVIEGIEMCPRCKGAVSFI